MKRRSKGLAVSIFAALFAGAALGILLYEFAPAGFVRDTLLLDGVFRFAGSGFLRLMQMLVVPLVFFSLVCGASAIGDTKTLGRVGVKTICFYLLTTAIAICIALGAGELIRPGAGLDMSAVSPAEITIDPPASVVDTLLDIIPTNPIAALAQGDMLPTILFALLVGVILARLADRTETVYNFCRQANEIMMEMTDLVMRLAPAGVFCLMTRTFAETGWGASVHMAKYMLAVVLALAVQCLVVYMLMLRTMTGLSPRTFLRKFSPVMGFAFSTASSNAAIPLSIDALRSMGVSRRISSFTIPLGSSINMDGTTIMQGVAVVFIAQAYGLALTPMDYLIVIVTATLASIGTAGVPSVGLVTLSLVLTTIGLPVEGIGLIIGVDRLLDMLRTAVNVAGDAVCTTIVACQDGACNREQFNQPAR